MLKRFLVEMPNQLAKALRDSGVKVKEHSMINESSLSRIWDKTQNHTCGAISGYRNENDAETNRQNNAEISAYLIGRGYSVTRVSGNYIEDNDKEVAEPSFFVCNHTVEGDDFGQLEKDLRMLGSRYNQESVLIVPVGGKGAFLVGTSDDPTIVPSKGQKITVGSGVYGAVAGQYLSRVRGREFAFEDKVPPKTRNGKWFVSSVVKKINEEEHHS